MHSVLRTTFLVVILFFTETVAAAGGSGVVAGYRVTKPTYLVSIASEVYHDERVWKDIAFWNGLTTPYTLSQGQILILKNLGRHQKVPNENRVSAAELSAARSAVSKVAPTARVRASVERELHRQGREWVYVVNERAPSLSMVARDLYGDRRYFGEIAQWNGLSTDAKLSLGQRLVIRRAPSVSLEEGTAILAMTWESLGNDDMVRRLGEEPVGVPRAVVTTAVAPVPVSVLRQQTAVTVAGQQTADRAPTPPTVAETVSVAEPVTAAAAVEHLIPTPPTKLPEKKIIEEAPVIAPTPSHGVNTLPAPKAKPKVTAKSVKPATKPVESTKILKMLSSTYTPNPPPKKIEKIEKIEKRVERQPASVAVQKHEAVALQKPEPKVAHVVPSSVSVPRQQTAVRVAESVAAPVAEPVGAPVAESTHSPSELSAPEENTPVAIQAPVGAGSYTTVITSAKYMSPLRTPALLAKPRYKFPLPRKPAAIAAEARPTAAVRMPQPTAERKFVFMAPPVATCGCAEGAIAMCVPVSALIPMSSFEINNAPPPPPAVAQKPPPVPQTAVSGPQPEPVPAPTQQISAGAPAGTPIYVTVPVPTETPAPMKMPIAAPKRKPASGEYDTGPEFQRKEEEDKYWFGQDADILIDNLTRQLNIQSPERAEPIGEPSAQ